MPKPKTPEQPAIHPGDVVQVIDEKHPLQGGLALVSETHRWGVGVLVHAFQNGQLVQSYQRLKARPVQQYALVGPAAMMPTEVLQLRQKSLASAAEVAREAENG